MDQRAHAKQLGPRAPPLLRITILCTFRPPLRNVAVAAFQGQ